jgi:hypothetical protein
LNKAYFNKGLVNEQAYHVICSSIPCIDLQGV